MAELDDPATSHRKIADLARTLGIQVVAVETDLYGIAPVSLSEAIDLVSSLGSTDAVLVKGSRVAGLERLVDAVSRR
jgi:UDP-N-acetylmuramoyl-tripeptide--D-alanyl-D-alanine ligase